jgi:hypothetical protein
MDSIFGSLRQDLCFNDLYRIHQQIVRIRSVGVDWLLEEYRRMFLTSYNLTETWISLLLQGMLRLSSGSVQQCIVDLIDKKDHIDINLVSDDVVDEIQKQTELDNGPC